MAAGSDFKTQWNGWSARFAALQAREKHMVIGAVCVAILFGGYTLWIEPGKLQSARLRQTLIQQQTEQTQMVSQMQSLAGANQDPDAARRVQLQQLRDQLGQIDKELKGFDKTLVSPSQAPALLQTLLARHRGLSLVSLSTLAPQPLITPPEAKPAKDGAKPVKEEAPPVMTKGNIYKHGLQIKLAGSYQDLMAYVTELENSPQKMLWGTMSLKVKTHPACELMLTVYTLSLDETWLVV
jgi:MSHA biogenesis protein MshJ